MVPTSMIGAFTFENAIVGEQHGVVRELDIGGDGAEAGEPFIDERAQNAGAGDGAAFDAIEISERAAAQIPTAVERDVRRAREVHARAPNAVAADVHRALDIHIRALNAAAAEHAADRVDSHHGVRANRPLGVRIGEIDREAGERPEAQRVGGRVAEGRHRPRVDREVRVEADPVHRGVAAIEIDRAAGHVEGRRRLNEATAANAQGPVPVKVPAFRNVTVLPSRSTRPPALMTRLPVGPHTLGALMSRNAFAPTVTVVLVKVTSSPLICELFAASVTFTFPVIDHELLCEVTSSSPPLRLITLPMISPEPAPQSISSTPPLLIVMTLVAVLLPLGSKSASSILTVTPDSTVSDALLPVI